MKRFIKLALFITAAWITCAKTTFSQTQPNPAGYSISTPRPINLAASTTNPDAVFIQRIKNGARTSDGAC